ncbi:uncharacterized protein ColSpa_09668 [Colletotrichum spaethianum]|uniref:Uncharacterized protein n=1 Tax=Colletotrichum spaethianum TaxID=700344 RepID=A0AA37UQU7_9PEZI|nr:uncharacterized protein ColSpa_09668 [Colletotrichum spaethianum]GKT49487.1 hypothetical protein ColSpa_09668 [Colletotrichum spaethianum]
MAEYKLNIRIDKNCVTKFKTSGHKICLAFGFDTTARPGSTKFNVIGYSSASSSAFASGVRFDVATTPQPISSGETWILPPDWSDGSSTPDPDVPDDDILFVNEASSASAVVYKTVNGVEAPVYVSHFGPLPPGRESLTPKLQAAVWFQMGAETGAIVDEHDTPIHVIDFTKESFHEVVYGPSGSWAMVE